MADSAWTSKMDYLDLDDNALKEKDTSIRQSWQKGNETPMNIGIYMANLARTAFKSGRPICAELLAAWALSPSPDDPFIRSWALYYLLQTGFWSTTESCFHLSCESKPSRNAISLLLEDEFILAAAPHGWKIDMVAEDLSKCRRFLDEKSPWVPLEERVGFLKSAFSRYIRTKREEAGGGWN